MERGLAPSREAARRRIMAGEVLVDEQRVTKAGAFVALDAPMRLKDKGPGYASRGGIKLAGALRDLEIRVAGRIALDVGASTGGFTDCLLKQNAARVYAVDVGYGQLDWKLRQDPRVVVLEKTNIRYLEPSSLQDRPDLAVIDVSFISLRLVLPRVQKLLGSEAEVLALIKPQFEVGRGRVAKGGVVRSDAEHARVIGEVSEVARGLGFRVAGVVPSQLRGPKGNREFFIHLNI